MLPIKFHTQLELLPPIPLLASAFKYNLRITAPNSKPKVVGGRFDSKGMTKRIYVDNPDAIILYEILYNGTLLQRVSAKAYIDDNHSVYEMKTTTAATQLAPNHIKEIYLDNSEVAWYLVKSPDIMGKIVSKLFQKPLGVEDWDKLQKNNPHLKNLNYMCLLHPGQVIILSDHTSGSKQLEEYKQQALQAQQQLNKMMEDPDFDPQFFAQHYEFFYDVLSTSQYAGITNEPIIKQSTPETAGKAEHGEEGSSASISYDELAEKTIDGSLNFTKGARQGVLNAYAEIVQAMENEKKAGSSLANRKNYAAFKRKYAGLYRTLDSKLGKKMFEWDTGKKTEKLRKTIRKDAFARGKNYKGGLSALVKHMEEVGKIARALRIGGNLLVGYSTYEAGHEIYNAYQTGEDDKFHHAAAVEPLKLAGGVVGGEVGVAIGLKVGLTLAAITLATGGSALVVIGVCVIAGGLAGSFALGKGGEMLGEKLYEKNGGKVE